MDAGNPNSSAQTVKDRVRNLFSFLLEANRLRFAPARKLSDQERVIPLFKLPADPSIQLIRPVPTHEGEPGVDFSLVVTRPVITSCPSPQKILHEWLVSGWDDPFERHIRQRVIFRHHRQTLLRGIEGRTFRDGP